MFPVLPAKIGPELEQLVIEVATASAALGRGVHPFILVEIARFMAKVNSYYTNAMEGNPSKIRDIEAALNNQFAPDAAMRNFQLEHVAHIQVQQDMLRRLREEPALRICSRDFLCWLHEQFYLKLPQEMRVAKTLSGKFVPLEPGRLRDRGVTVGAHAAPETEANIVACLNAFADMLGPEKLTGHNRILGLAAAHHRLLWIHPFSDGNGRVARLFTMAYGVRIGLGENLLWTVTRAFARQRREYDARLAMADQSRRNDLDGRGPLSEENLVKFCTYFLACCKDQIQFMAERLRLDELERHYRTFIAAQVAEKRMTKAGAKVMKSILVQGKVARGAVLDICRVRQRRATQVIRELLDAQFVRSASAYGDLRLNISAEMAAMLFPELA